MSDSSENKRYTGRVKWFNNKSGFGFITQCEGGQGESKDIFVHWSSIKVENSQYKYLVQGEYVDFSLVKPERGNHEFHAVEVSGVKGGNLMCETRRENFNAQRVSRKGGNASAEASGSADETHRSSAAPRRENAPRPVRGGRGTGVSVNDEEGFTAVSKKRNVRRGGGVKKTDK